MGKKTFNVLLWDFNSDKMTHYDVLPYLRRCIAGRKKEAKKAEKSKRIQKLKEERPDDFKRYYAFPDTYKDFVDFITNEARYQYWGRCEYEMICHGWPVRKNNHKLDVYEQIEMNLGTICEILWEELNK